MNVRGEETLDVDAIAEWWVRPFSSERQAGQQMITKRGWIQLPPKHCTAPDTLVNKP